MKLNFTLSEIVASTTAKRKNIDNTPSIKEADNMMELIVNCLQPIRDKLKKPMVVSSGYRCPELNKLVGGKSNSQHLTGCACDFTVKGMSVDQVYEFIKNGGFTYDQLIHEGTWVHISYKKTGNRKQAFKI